MTNYELAKLSRKPSQAQKLQQMDFIMSKLA